MTARYGQGARAQAPSIGQGGYKATLWAASRQAWATWIRARQRGEQRFMHIERAFVGRMGGAGVRAKQKEVSV